MMFPMGCPRRTDSGGVHTGSAFCVSQDNMPQVVEADNTSMPSPQQEGAPAGHLAPHIMYTSKAASNLIQAVARCNAGAEQDAVQSLSDDGSVLSMVQDHRHRRDGGAPQQHEHLALHPLQVACMQSGAHSQGAAVVKRI